MGSVWLPLRNTKPLPAKPVTLPPTRKLLVVQVTDTFVTFAPLTVPLELPSTHSWVGEVGCLAIFTVYAVPSVIAVPNAKEPLNRLFSVWESLSCNERPVPRSPVITPPTLNTPGAGGGGGGFSGGGVLGGGSAGGNSG